jgi:hypothetical protein
VDQPVEPEAADGGDVVGREVDLGQVVVAAGNDQLGQMVETGKQNVG